MQIAMTRVILYVRDIARVKGFYETHFAFRTIEEIDANGRSCWRGGLSWLFILLENRFEGFQ